MTPNSCQALRSGATPVPVRSLAVSGTKVFHHFSRRTPLNLLPLVLPPMNWPFESSRFVQIRVSGLNA